MVCVVAVLTAGDFLNTHLGIKGTRETTIYCAHSILLTTVNSIEISDLLYEILPFNYLLLLIDFQLIYLSNIRLIPDLKIFKLNNYFTSKR